MRIFFTTLLKRWDRPINYKAFTMEYPVFTLSALFLALMRDGTGLVRLSLAAALIHESGHILICCLLQKRCPLVKAGIWGFRMEGWSLNKKQDLAVTAAGPLANLVACLVFLGLARYRAGYALYGAAAANLCTAAFNLLPVGPLDGKRILDLIRD